MSKYIKNVNWPWVEIRDAFGGDGTIVINVNEIAAIWDNPDTIYKYGVCFKDGAWNKNFQVGGLTELKELVMNRKIIKFPTSSVSPVSFTGIGGLDCEVEMMHENQTLYDWLNENGRV